MIEWLRHIASDPSYVPVVAAWFAAIASGVAAFVTVVTAKITARTTTNIASRSVYINSVTAERSKWIDALRNSISEYAGTAERIISRRKDPTYDRSAEWAADVQALRTNLANLKMRLNPREEMARNFLSAANKLDQAARIHRWSDVDLASEIMIRHSQWILKSEWNRVKIEAASGVELTNLQAAEKDLEEDYKEFLALDGSLHRLKAIGAGKSEVEISFLRSEMDTTKPAVVKNSYIYRN